MCGEGPEEDGACPALVALTVEGETTSPPASRAPHRPKVLHPGENTKDCNYSTWTVAKPRTK